MRRAETAAAARHAGGASGSKISSAPTGASMTGRRSLRPNCSTEASTLRHVAQHARPEGDLVERHAVAAHRGLGLGGADDVVPGILVEIGARLADEFVQVLECFVAGAEFDVPLRLDAGRVIHCCPPENLRPYLIAYRVRPSKTILKSHGCEAWAGRPIPALARTVSERCQKFRPGRRDFAVLPAGVASRP